jgi:(E)-4-hydroxy-3-methylbut-2-enyl-diphosphate synthase
MKRETKAVMVRNVQIGGGAPVVVQSMTKTDTTDVAATVRQIEEMVAAGCEVVRIAAPSKDDAIALKEFANAFQSRLLLTFIFITNLL